MYYFDDQEYLNYVLNALKNGAESFDAYIDGLRPIIFELEAELNYQDGELNSTLINAMFNGSFVPTTDHEKDYFIINLIHFETDRNRLMAKKSFRKLLTQLEVIKSVSRHNGEIVIVDSDKREIKIQTILGKFPQIKKAVTGLDKIETRLEKCHHNCIKLCLNLHEQEMEVVTGYITSFKKNSHFLHSWIEFVDKNGDEKVADCNLNAVFNKADYYRLYCAEAVSRATADNLVELFNAKKTNPNVALLYVKEILLFMPEILKELRKDKNHKILRRMTQEKLSE